MANETTTTTFTNAMTLAVGRRFLKTIVPRVVVGNLFNVQDEGEGLSTKVARMPDSSGSITDPVSETGDVSVVAVTPTSVTITPDATGIAFDPSDLLRSSSPAASLDAFVEHGSEMLIQQSEDDIHALFSGFSGSVGATTTDLTAATFLSAAVTLKMSQVPYPIFAVLAPIQIQDLALDLGGLPGISQGTSVGLLEVSGGAPGLKGAPGSIPTYESPRAVALNSNADREGFMGHRDAITLRRKWMLRPEMERDAKGLSTNVVVSSAYGLAETADSFGVQIVSDHE